MGLYIVKSMIETMGGGIELALSTPRGSTFSFTVPLWTGESQVTDGPDQLAAAKAA